jgi:hypothetical protein
MSAWSCESGACALNIPHRQISAKDTVIFVTGSSSTNGKSNSEVNRGVLLAELTNSYLVANPRVTPSLEGQTTFLENGVCGNFDRFGRSSPA